jgi:circadian clock protein KaiB
VQLNSKSGIPLSFKGIALFTPGGDCIYGIDINKQDRWHLHLCVALQEFLNLPEPPHFLVPGYTATVDRWQDLHTQQVMVTAEAYPPVLRYQSLLNAIFDLGHKYWQPAPWNERWCDPLMLLSYRQQFPELWNCHNLVVQLGAPAFLAGQSSNVEGLDSEAKFRQPLVRSYVFRLFVSGLSLVTERTLNQLHQSLEESLHQPYTLEVVDILQHPDKAEAAQISATPTLIRIWPEPLRRVVGEIKHVNQVLPLLISSPTQSL